MGELEVLVGIVNKHHLPVIVAEHDTRFISYVVAIAGEELAGFSVADKDNIRGGALIPDAVAGMNLVPVEVVQDVGFHTRQTGDRPKRQAEAIPEGLIGTTSYARGVL